MIKIIESPLQSDWATICQRPTFSSEQLNEKVQQIIDEVCANKDKSLFEYARRFDKVELESLKVSEIEFDEAEKEVSQELKDAITVAARNIEAFHSAQFASEEKIETTPGVVCWRKNVAIENVGLYIPGGSAPLFSTILMLTIPAKIAGCKRIVLCTPPNSSGNIHPAIVYTAKFLGITELYKVGGAQAIAAMAYGTETIPQINKIFGPGNQFVTKAKELVQKAGIAIDLPAGPSEVLVIADENSNADFVASDLLSQAEHGPDSQVFLVTNNKTKIAEIQLAVETQLNALPRKELAQKALDNSKIIYFDTVNECIDFSNCYAPEHLILAVENAENHVSQITNAGSVFLGNYSPESAGDYASGTNHTLPTNGYAKSYSGVSLDSFLKKITFQKISKEGLLNLGKTIEIMAEAESLFAHKNAVSVRLNSSSSNLPNGKA